MSYSRYWWVLGWLQVVILLVACLWPTVELPGPEGTDKGAHLLSFGWLMLWFSQVVSRHRVLLAGLIIAYGGLIELLQTFSGYRQGSGWDWLADGLGVLLAWAAAEWIVPDIVNRFEGANQD
ncbi:MAG: VanZ family protein [Gammaproteobacteria bacterium]